MPEKRVENPNVAEVGLAAAGVRVGDTVGTIDYVGEGQYRIEVGQLGVFRDVALRASVLVKLEAVDAATTAASQPRV